MRWRLFLLLLLLAAATARADDRPLLEILEETGQTREGFPVLRLHPGREPIIRALSRGFSGRLLRLYRVLLEDRHRQGGPPPESAYLLLSSQQGGFPRWGFYLGEEDKRTVAYVDLFRRQDFIGRFGAADQIFPHEWGHIILRLLTGEAKPCCANQVHAIGVRTDPMTAFDEGFAEHFQIMALEDPGAHPATRALTADAELERQAAERLRGYQRELSARWAPFTRWRMTFPLWFSQAEQVLRYHAVKRNAFAFEPDLPERLLAGSDPYLAYLLQNLLPGTPGIRPKSAARMLSTEGVIAALMYRWMQRAPLEDGYRKLFRAMELHQPHTMAELIAAYQRAFPEEAAAIDALVRETLAGQALPAAPEIWLANPDFHTGSTVFDQFRSVPRTHTFDLNAASVVDLAGVPGVSHAQAEAILKSAPYARLGDLRVTPELMNRFRRMAAEMEKLRVDKDKMETELPFQTILLSFVWRALGGVALAAAFGAVLYRLVRRVRWWRAALNGLGAALVAMPAAWMGASPWFALLFAVPAVLWQLGRYRAWCPTLRVLLAWIAAAIPAVALVRPWLD